MSLDGFLNYADVLATQAESGEIRVNLGDSITGAGIDNDVATWGIDGFVSRPNDPDAEGAAQALYVVDGQEKRILGTRDVRSADNAGLLGPGDRAIISGCDARFLLTRGDNAVTLSTENASIRIEPGKITLAVPGGGAMVIDATGVHITGPYLGADTDAGNFGLINGVVPPPVTHAILKGASGVAGTPSAKWTVA